MSSLATEEHPFAEYIRILGKGKKGSRPLTQQEAYQAMRMILADAVEPIQLGAFLMLMRVKEESAAELAGFAQAARDSLGTPEPGCNADLDWPSYAGKRRHLPWFILSALLLAENGVKVFMHGASGHTAGRLYTEDALRHLAIEPASGLQEVAGQLQQSNFSFLPLERFCPKLRQMLELRSLLGLRSPVHSLARMLNPLNSHCSIQSIFHPGYRAVHQHAALLAGQVHMAVFKGEGGEVERNPDVPCLVQSVHDGALSDEEWPALFTKRHIKPEQLELGHLAAVWRGKMHDEYAEATVIGTAAVALKLLGRAASHQEAQALAESYWHAHLDLTGL
jgi:anthranilate phosphoribosyltransferase